MKITEDVTDVDSYSNRWNIFFKILSFLNNKKKYFFEEKNKKEKEKKKC
jgi:hypothetical protein